MKKYTPFIWKYLMVRPTVSRIQPPASAVYLPRRQTLIISCRGKRPKKFRRIAPHIGSKKWKFCRGAE